MVSCAVGVMGENVGKSESAGMGCGKGFSKVAAALAWAAETRSLPKGCAVSNWKVASPCKRV